MILDLELIETALAYREYYGSPASEVIDFSDIHDLPEGIAYSGTWVWNTKHRMNILSMQYEALNPIRFNADIYTKHAGNPAETR